MLRRRAGIVLVAALGLAGLAAPWLAPYDPAEQLDPAAGRYLPPGTVRAAVDLGEGRWLLAERVERRDEDLRVERLGRIQTLPLEAVHNLTPDGVADRRVFLLGTDKFGRDMLSRMLHATRVSLAIGTLAAALALTLGVAVGAVAAMGGGLLDSGLMRLVDALLAFPRLFLVLALTAFIYPEPLWIVLILGCTSWMGVSRLTRAELLGLRRRDFVLAAEASGASKPRVLTRHLLPNGLTPVLVDTSLRIGDLILIEAALSFLGMGIQAPTPSWGNMVADGREVLRAGWWLTAFPGGAIAATVIAFNLLGDGLRDRLDPRARRAD